MKLADARKLAERLAEQMRPHVHRIEIAGSIRRGKLEVKDLELVCIPRWDRRLVQVGLLEEEQQVNALHEWATSDACAVRWIKPGTPQVVDWPVKADGRYWRGLLEGIKLDLFLVTAENWGIQFVIRTGCAEYSQALVTRSREHGYPCAGGYLHELTDEGPIVPTPEESDVFELLGLWQPSPGERDSAAKVRPKPSGPANLLDAYQPSPVDAQEHSGEETEPEPETVQTPVPEVREWRVGSGYLCGGCWSRFPVDDLTEVAERVGRGYRCAECLK